MTGPTPPIRPAVEWHPFDYEDKAATAPKHHYEPVWIADPDTPGRADIGYFDGYTFRLWGGSDDVSVQAWAEITYPAYPPGFDADEPGDTIPA